MVWAFFLISVCDPLRHEKILIGEGPHHSQEPYWLLFVGMVVPLRKFFILFCRYVEKMKRHLDVQKELRVFQLRCQMSFQKYFSDFYWSHSLFFLDLNWRRTSYSGGCLEVGWLSVSQKWDAAHLHQNALENFWHFRFLGPTPALESRSPWWGLGSCIFTRRCSNSYASSNVRGSSEWKLVMPQKLVVLSALALASKSGLVTHCLWKNSSLNWRESHFPSSQSVLLALFSSIDSIFQPSSHRVAVGVEQLPKHCCNYCWSLLLLLKSLCCLSVTMSCIFRQEKGHILTS